VAFTVSIGFAGTITVPGTRGRPVSRSVTRDRPSTGKHRKWPNFRTHDYPMVVNEKKEIKKENADFVKEKHYLRTHSRVLNRNNRKDSRNPWATKRSRKHPEDHSSQPEQIQAPQK
jgi:hypothetical protein